MTNSISNHFSDSYAKTIKAPRKVRTKVRKSRVTESSKNEHKNILWFPEHIYNPSYGSRSKHNANYVCLQTRVNKKTVPLGRVYRFVFWPKNHIPYYKYEAHLRNININDVFDLVIAGEIPLCPNDSKHMYTDVQFLKDNPGHYIIRNGQLKGYDDLKELELLEQQAIKNNRLPNNMMPDIRNGIQDHVFRMENPDIVDSIDDDNDEDDDYDINDSNDIDANVTNKSDVNVNNSSFNSEEYINDIMSHSTDKDLNDKIEKEVTESLNHSTVNKEVRFSTSIFTGDTLCDFNKLYNSKPNKKEEITYIPKTIEKNFYSTFLIRFFFEKEGLQKDFIKSFIACGNDLDTAIAYTETAYAALSSQIITESLVYAGGVEAQKSNAIGFYKLLLGATFIDLFTEMSKPGFLTMLNQCRMERLKNSEALYCDHTVVIHSCKNNDLSTLTIDNKKNWVDGVSTTIGISDKSLTPAYLKISPGNINDYTNGANILSFFDIADAYKHFKKIVVDRGYSSKANYKLAEENNISFITALRSSDSIVEKLIDNYGSTILEDTCEYRIFEETKDVIGVMLENTEDNQQLSHIIDKDSPYKYLYLFCDLKSRLKQLNQLDNQIIHIKSIISNCTTEKEVARAIRDDTKVERILRQFYDHYYDPKLKAFNTELLFNQRNNLIKNNKAYQEHKKSLGFYVNVCTTKITPAECYHFYKHRAYIEGYNKHMKDSLGMRTGRAHSTPTFIGRQIMTFATSIITYSLRRRMEGIQFDDDGNKLPVNVKLANKFTNTKELFSQLNNSKLNLNLESGRWSLCKLPPKMIAYLEFLGVKDLDLNIKKRLSEIIPNEFRVSIISHK